MRWLSSVNKFRGAQLCMVFFLRLTLWGWFAHTTAEIRIDKRMKRKTQWLTEIFEMFPQRRKKYIIRQIETQKHTITDTNTHTQTLTPTVKLDISWSVKIITVHRRCGLYGFYLCLFDKNQQYLAGYWMSNPFRRLFPFVRVCIHSEYLDFISLFHPNTLRLPPPPSSTGRIHTDEIRLFHQQLLDFVFLYFFLIIYLFRSSNLFIEI